MDYPSNIPRIYTECKICGKSLEDCHPFTPVCSETCRKKFRKIYRHKYYVKKKEYIKAKLNKWRKKNPEKVAEQNKRYRKRQYTKYKRELED